MPNPDGTPTQAEMDALQPGIDAQAAAIQAKQRNDLIFGGKAAPVVRGPESLAAQTFRLSGNDPRSNHDIANGTALPGTYSAGGGGHLNQQSDIHQNLSWNEELAQRQGAFGLGSSNNAQTNAMLGNAGATGDKYSADFNAQGAAAGTASTAAGARGLSMYGGNTGQYQAGLGHAAQDRGMQTGAYGQLMRFAGGPEGPSAAQAQLNMATDANMGNTLALARSGRGLGGSQSAMRQAMAQNAVTQQQAGNQSAALRAQENQAFRQNRLSALGTAGNIAGQTVGADQAYGQLGLAGAQYQTDTALKGTQLNDASSQAWAAQHQAATGAALGADVGAQTQELNINSTALTGRENEYASANQTAAMEKGFAQQASIADANRQQAYVAGGLSAAGSVIQAVSDERYKTNILPLGGASSVAPLPSQSGGSVMGGPAQKMGPTEAEAADERHKALGSDVGKVAGAGVGAAVGGPVGAAVGGFLGGSVGKMFSDVRSKTNVRPLDEVNPYGEATRRVIDEQNPYDRLQSLAKQYGAAGVANSPKAVSEYTTLKPDQEKGFAQWLKQNNVRDLDNPDAHYDYRGAYLAGEGRGANSGHFTDRFKQHGHPTFSVESQYSAGPKDGGSWDGETYLPQAAQDPSGRTAQRYARGGGNQILSEGDALLADSARNAPGSMYDYKDKRDGAGTYTGPMAQDLAAHPVTAGMVGQDPGTGKLFVVGARAATTSLAQNHAQQNQLDALGHEITKLKEYLPEKLKRKAGDERATAFVPTGTGGL